MNSSPTYYQILCVEPNAPLTEIREMYHKLAKKYHADANSSDPQLQKWSHEMMTKLNEAYNVLKDANARQHYDYSLQNQQYSDDFGSEAVYIENLDHAREIFMEGVNHFPVNAPTLELDQAARDGMRNILMNKTAKYLSEGVPAYYSMPYMARIVEDVAFIAIERVQEQHARYSVMSIYMVVCLIIGVYFAFRFSDGFLSGVFDIGKFAFFSAIYYMVLSWVARFIARGFKSNLTGFRGLIVNGLVALFILFGVLSQFF